MAAKKLTADQAERQLQERWRAAVEAITPEALARGHTHSLEIYQAVLDGTLTDEVWYCSRRAAKTETALGVLLLVAILAPDRSNLYLGLTDFPVLRVRRRWLRLLKKFKVPCTNIEKDAAYETEFPNGSRVVFGTTANRAHIQNYLGDSMGRGSVGIVDESQSQGQVLKEIVEEILGPMISERSVDNPEPGRIIVCGTAVDSAGGYFDTLYERCAILDADGRLVGIKPNAGWTPRSWSRFDNPGLVDEARSLADFCRKHSYESTDPFILQVFHGLRVFDVNATCYRYSVARNRWKGTPAPWTLDPVTKLLLTDFLAPGRLIAVLPPPGIDTFAAGIDAGSHDRTGIVLWGWSSRHLVPGVWQVAEWSTEPKTPVATSQYIAVLAAFRTHYGRVVRMIRDDGSSQTIDDSHRIETGVNIEPPTKGKGSKRARVERLADLLATDRAHVLEGSALETDLMLTRWDQIARSEGRWKFDDSIIHPDVADAGTYGLEGTFIEPPKRDEKRYASEAEAIQAQTRALFQKSLNTRPVRRDPPRTSSSLWGRIPR